MPPASRIARTPASGACGRRLELLEHLEADGGGFDLGAERRGARLRRTAAAARYIASMSRLALALGDGTLDLGGGCRGLAFDARASVDGAAPPARSAILRRSSTAASRSRRRRATASAASAMRRAEVLDGDAARARPAARASCAERWSSVISCSTASRRSRWAASSCAGGGEAGLKLGRVGDGGFALLCGEVGLRGRRSRRSAPAMRAASMVLRSASSATRRSRSRA